MTLGDSTRIFLTLACAGQPGGTPSEGRHALDGSGGLAPVEVPCWGNRIARPVARCVRLLNENKPVGIAKRQRLQQYGIHHTENRGVQSDSQRQKHYGRAGEPRFLAEDPRTVTHVLPKSLKLRNPAALAVVFLGLFDAPEVYEWVSARLLGRHPRSPLVLHIKLQIRTHPTA